MDHGGATLGRLSLHTLVTRAPGLIEEALVSRLATKGWGFALGAGCCSSLSGMERASLRIGTSLSRVADTSTEYSAKILLPAIQVAGGD